MAGHRVVRAREREDEQALMAAEMREGLTSQPRWLPCKYFYDERGSRLFEQITRLPEYYPTRTEERILETIAGDVIAAARPSELMELGSGNGTKVRLLLDAMAREGLLRRLVLLDISESVLEESVARLASDYPGLEATGIVGDFVRDLAALGPGGGRMAVFLAGTVGNLHPTTEVPSFLKALAAQLEPGDSFLLGVDLVKDEARLHAAYNDAAGVTAEFNRNILRVVNDRLDADFDPDAFEHLAFYDRENAWIEMRLRALRACRVRVPRAGLDLCFDRGDAIRTEISCKYTRASLEGRLEGTDLRLERWFTDPDQLFAVTLLRRMASSPAIVPSGTSRG
jgi:L-histidine N-alpha-methyltransferase